MDLPLLGRGIRPGTPSSLSSAAALGHGSLERYRRGPLRGTSLLL